MEAERSQTLSDPFRHMKDLLSQIFSNLSIYDISQASRVCKTWWQELQSDVVWQPLYHFRFDQFITVETQWRLPPGVTSYRECYRKRVVDLCHFCRFPTKNLDTAENFLVCLACKELRETTAVPMKSKKESHLLFLALAKKRPVVHVIPKGEKAPTVAEAAVWLEDAKRIQLEKRRERDAEVKRELQRLPRKYFM